MARIIKGKKLTLKQMNAACSYAKKRWPKDTVKVRSLVNENGEVVFDRHRVSTREICDLPKIKKPKSST